MTQPIITRAEAKARGLTRYFTGKPCTRDHLAQRRASTCACLDCEKIYYVSSGRAHGSVRHTEYMKKQRIRDNARYAENAEKKRSRSAARYAAKRDEINARLRAHPEIGSAAASVRRTRERKNTVATSKTEKAQIALIYRERDRLTRVTGVKWHVDHVVPISKGGAHELRNLQLLPATQNLRKHARRTELTKVASLINALILSGHRGPYAPDLS